MTVQKNIAYALASDCIPRDERHERVAAILAERFELADRSPTRWDLYRRKPGPTAGR